MALLLGARDLGLTVAWRFGFLGYGQHAASTPGAVHLDVGGRLEPGVLDHHQGDPVGSGLSASDIVLHHPELVYNHLLASWIARYEDGRLAPGTAWTPTIITHVAPDWDSVVAAYLTIRLVEDGGFPPGAAALVEYASEVDQGRYRLSLEDPAALDPPHLGYLAIQNLPGLSRDSEGQMRLGLELVARCLDDVGGALGSLRRSMRHGEDFHAGKPGAAGWRSDPRFSEATALLDSDLERFRRDLVRARKIDSVLLPAADGEGSLAAPALVSPEPTESALNKYWVRATGHPYYICPMGEPSAKGADGLDRVYPRVVLSLDPAWHIEGRKPSLRGLGFALERAESEARRRMHEGADDRGGAPRYGDGYCDNGDPWYDGRAHDFTIVDAPRDGTVLPYAQVVATATSTSFWETPLEEGVAVLVWAEQATGDRPAGARALERFDGMSPTLDALYGESVELGRFHEPLGEDLPVGVRAETVRRFPPQGTAPPLRITYLRAGSGATLEDLVRARDILVRDGPVRRSPDYSFARIRLGRHLPDPTAAGRLLLRLGGGELTQLPDIAAGGDHVLFNTRALVLRQAGAGAAVPGPDVDLEVLLYVAFLNESLVTFSRDLGELVPSADQRLERLRTGEVRSRLLRFQTRYHQLEVSRLARGRVLYSHLADSMRLAEHYHEVLSEADRLAEVEERMDEAEERAAEERRARAEKVIGGVLYFLTVAGVFGTVISFVTMDSATRSSVLFLGIALPILLITTLVPIGVYLYRSRRRRAEKE